MFYSCTHMATVGIKGLDKIVVFIAPPHESYAQWYSNAVRPSLRVLFSSLQLPVDNNLLP